MKCAWKTTGLCLVCCHDLDVVLIPTGPPAAWPSDPFFGELLSAPPVLQEDGPRQFKVFLAVSFAIPPPTLLKTPKVSQQFSTLTANSQDPAPILVPRTAQEAGVVLSAGPGYGAA